MEPSSDGEYPAGRGLWDSQRRGPIRIFEVFDGHLLVPIHAGDIVVLRKACSNLPIEQRYAFAGITHHSWHGSACEQNGHISFILGQYGGSRGRMRSIVDKFGGASPSERELMPMVRSLFAVRRALNAQRS